MYYETVISLNGSIFEANSLVKFVVTLSCCEETISVSLKHVDTGRIFCKYCNVVVDHVRKNKVDRNLIEGTVFNSFEILFVNNCSKILSFFYESHPAASHYIYVIHGWVSSISLQSLTPRSSSNAYELTVCFDRHQIKLGSIYHWPIINI